MNQRKDTRRLSQVADLPFKDVNDLLQMFSENIPFGDI
jgi:hypothetical protein